MASVLSSGGSAAVAEAALDWAAVSSFAVAPVSEEDCWASNGYEHTRAKGKPRAKICEAARRIENAAKARNLRGRTARDPDFSLCAILKMNFNFIEPS